jgi:hypothetical protein
MNIIKTVKFKKNYIIISIFFCFFFSQFAKAQDNDVSVVVGEKNLTLNDPFIVTVVIKYIGEAQIPDCKFPELPNFSKKGLSKSTSRAYISGQPIFTCTITQNYTPKKLGLLKLSPFKINVNGIDLKAEGGLVRVSKSTEGTIPEDKKNVPTTEEDLLGNNEEKNEPTKTKEDAFLQLTTSKTNPFVGEGFTVTLAFYVAENNSTEMGFDHNGIQIPEITKKIKPENCWEESFGITELQETQMMLNGKAYTQYKLYQATFYPLNNKTIVFPSVDFHLLKRIMGKDGEKISKTINFSTKPIIVKIKDLPTHPLKQQVSVGSFSIKESLNKTKVTTGKSVQYKITLKGDGYNIKLSEMKNDSIFDFFAPEIEANIIPDNEKIITTKTFTFQIIPKRAGNFALSKYFKWVYFNVNTAKYDTLRSNLQLKVSGATIQTVDTPPSIVSVYDGLQNLDTSQEESNFDKMLRDEANIIIAIMLIGTIFIFLPSKNRRT